MTNFTPFLICPFIYWISNNIFKICHFISYLLNSNLQRPNKTFSEKSAFEPGLLSLSERTRKSQNLKKTIKTYNSQFCSGARNRSKSNPLYQIVQMNGKSKKTKSGLCSGARNRSKSNPLYKIVQMNGKSKKTKSGLLWNW